MIHSKLNKTLFLICFLLQMGISTKAQFAYYPATDSAFVRVLNLSTQTIIATIPVGQNPVAASANPEGTKVYIANQNSNSISVIDVATQTVTATIPVGNAPVDIRVSKDGNKVYVANKVSNTISVINANTNAVSNTINLTNQPFYLGLHPSGNKLYISTNNGITILNTTNNAILSTIPLGNPPTGVVFTNDGSKGYSIVPSLIEINTLVDTITYLPNSIFSSGNYSNIGLTQNGNKVFATGWAGYTFCESYDLTTLTMDPYNINSPYTANSGIMHNFSAGLDYVLVFGALNIIDANSLTTIQTIPMIYPMGSFYVINGNFVAFLHPEINVKGGSPSISILDGDNSPSLNDHTDFGNVNTTSSAYKTYRIENTGLAPLQICNISLSGPHASMFALGSLPPTIPVGGVDSFTVYFYPSSPGLKSATVTINNNDLTEGVYDFAIQGTGTLPKHIYVTNSSANTVGVYDENTNNHVMDINMDTYPNGLSLNPNKTKLYVTNSNSNTVSVMNTFTSQVIASVPVGNYPVGVCVSPNGNKIYVANKNSNTISVIDASTNTVSATITVGTNPIGICISPDGSNVYVSNNGSNNMSIINTSSNTITSTLPVGIAPYGITMSHDGSKVYIANSGSNTVSVLNTSNNTFSIPFVTGYYPYAIVENSLGNTIYVSNFADFTVSAIHTMMGFSNILPVGNYPSGMSLSEDGSKLFVTCYGNDTMRVINTLINFVSNSFQLGSGPISFGNSIGTIGVPEIKVKGGGLILPTEITNYDYTPSTFDNTDFGNVNAGGSVTKTFYIQNTGSSDLTIHGIDMYGPDTSMFDIIDIPSTIPAGVTDSFTITFTPTSSGTKLAYIHIASNVPNLSQFYYGIQANGVGVFMCNLQLKYFLQGYYLGASWMQPVLLNQGAPAPIVTQTDLVSIELREPLSPYMLAYNYVGTLQTDGTIDCIFPAAVIGGNYFIVLKHRNSLETWSANPVLLTENTLCDFTTAANKAFGNNQIEVEPGIWAIYTGDVNQDGVVDGVDYNDWESDNNNFSAGYLATDLNGDGIVDGLDFLLWEMNNNSFIGAIQP